MPVELERDQQWSQEFCTKAFATTQKEKAVAVIATAHFIFLSCSFTHSCLGKTGRYLTARAKAITPRLVKVMVTTISIHEGK